MDAVIQTEGLGKRYGGKWALADCSLRGADRDHGGPGRAERCGQDHAAEHDHRDAAADGGPDPGGRGAPAAGAGQLSKVGFVAQDAPVYAGMSIADHFKLGAHLNPRWGYGPGQGTGRAPGP